jgi:hypothetical protein
MRGSVVRLQGWAERFAASDPVDLFDRGFDPRVQHLVMRRVAQLAETTITLTRQQWDSVASNLQTVSGPALANTQTPVADRVKFVQDLARVLEVVAVESTGASVIVWEEVVTHGYGCGEQVRTALLEAMGRHYASHNPYLRAIAPYGLFHLNHPQADLLLKRLRPDSTHRKPKKRVTAAKRSGGYSPGGP